MEKITDIWLVTSYYDNGEDYEESYTCERIEVAFSSLEKAREYLKNIEAPAARGIAYKKMRDENGYPVIIGELIGEESEVAFFELKEQTDDYKEFRYDTGYVEEFLSYSIEPWAVF